MEKIYTTNNYKQTQNLGENFARQLRARRAKKILKNSSQPEAVVLSLQGNLGGGKTTFLQGFARGLGIKEKILSPTFVILKRFEVKKTLKNFYHIDCYRVKNEKDILALDFERIISDPNNIVAIEWPEKIKKVLPKKIISIRFKFIDKDRREVKFKMW